MGYFPELRVKIKTLTAEAGIIRHEERKARNPLRAAYLSQHRRREVREWARSSQLAYGFLRGKRYAEIETGGATEPNWKDIRRIAIKFGRFDGLFKGAMGAWQQDVQELEDWLADAFSDWYAARLAWEQRHEEKLQVRRESRERYQALIAEEEGRKALAAERAAKKAAFLEARDAALQKSELIG